MSQKWKNYRHKFRFLVSQFTQEYHLPFDVNITHLHKANYEGSDAIKLSLQIHFMSL